VIEIGVDIPNATVMMIEDADRFGLAQLHQYRGRVGRSVHQSYCFLMTETSDPKSQERLSALLHFDSGFDLARADLKFRGPGEVYGLEQKGFPELKMANFYDLELIKKAREAALDLIEVDATLKNYPAVRKQLGDLEERAHLE
jgi:ATP-dependent DNA helicase RecG